MLKQIQKKRVSLEKSAEAIEELRRTGNLERANDFAKVIRACDRGDKWQLAISLLAEMIDGAIEPSVAVSTKVSSMCERLGKVDHFQMLMGSGQVQSPAATEVANTEDSGSHKKYSRGALLQRLRRRKARPSELVSTVDALVEDGHLDTVHGYTLALRMADSGEQWEWAVHLLDMCRKGPGLDVTACNVGIAACARSLQWEKALMVLDSMSREKVVPDLETYQKAMSACSRSGKWEAALVVLECAIGEELANGETYGIGMMACASADAWHQALSMLYGIDNCGIPKFEKDLLSYGVAVFGCERGGAWQWCLSLLGEMQSEQLLPDAVTYACAVQACKAAEKSDAASAIAAEMRKKRINGNAASILEEASWVIDGPEMQQPVALSALATMAPKEVNVYKYVAKKATPGDIDSVLETIESFAKSRSWLKIQGQDKRILLEKSLQAGDRIVEFGCYVGYSSLVMARQLRRLGGQGSVTTIEVDAATAYVARAMISFAGAEGEVQVRVGCASDWVATGQLGMIDFLLLDHRGTIYHEDLYAAEPLLSPAGRVFADNVLYPGAPLFLHYLDVKQYKIEIHELKEFLREDLDDWVVICRPTQDHGEMPRDTPPEFRRLSAEVDAISWRSQNGPVDWVGFQERLKPVFYQWKDERGL